MEEIPLREPVQEREVNLLVNSESLPNLLIVKCLLMFWWVFWWWLKQPWLSNP